MLTLPDRLAALESRIENGEEVTEDFLATVGALQSIDLARLGRQAVSEAIERQDQADAEFADLVGYEP